MLIILLLYDWFSVHSRLLRETRPFEASRRFFLGTLPSPSGLRLNVTEALWGEGGPFRAAKAFESPAGFIFNGKLKPRLVCLQIYTFLHFLWR